MSFMQGDISLFESLFKTHYQSLCKTAYRITGDKDASEDIVQNFFCKLWQNDKAIHISILFKSPTINYKIEF